MREEDWNDPIDSREEGTQKYASKAANAAASTVKAVVKAPVVITSAEIDAVISAPVVAAQKGSNAKVRTIFIDNYFYFFIISFVFMTFIRRSYPNVIDNDFNLNYINGNNLLFLNL